MEQPKVWLSFEKCPSCGSQEKVGETVAEEERAKGKMGDGFTPALMQEVTAIFDPRERHRLLRVPVLAAYFDICTNCGCLYCTRVERGEGMVSAHTPKRLS